MKENRLFAGIWYGSCKPDMSLFLRPLAETLTELYEKGKVHICVSVSTVVKRKAFSGLHFHEVCIFWDCDLPPGRGL